MPVWPTSRQPLTILGEVCIGEAYGADKATAQSKDLSANQSKESAKPVHKQSKPITADPSTFTFNMSFGEAIDILRNSTIPPLNIAVLWKDLNENADIYKDTPIGIDGLSGIPLRKHLELLLTSVSAGSAAELGYTVDGGVIIIATRDSLPIKRITRVYDVTDLVAPPANYFFMPGTAIPFSFGGMPFGAPYGGYGRRGAYPTPYGGQVSGTYVGGISRGTGVSSSPSIVGRSYGYDNGLADLIETLYGPGRRSYRNNTRTRRNR